MTAVPVYARALWGYPWRSVKVREGVLRKIDFCCFIALKGDCSSLKKWPAEGCWNDTACCALARSPQRGSESRQTRWPPPLLLSLYHGRSLSLSHPTCHTNTHSETTCINKSTHVQSGLCLPPARLVSSVHSADETFGLLCLLCVVGM